MLPIVRQEVIDVRGRVGLDPDQHIAQGSVAAETAAAVKAQVPCGAASMGPRLGGRGDTMDGVHMRRRGHASMGPRLGGRGDITGISGPSRNGALQWGRGSVAAETLRQHLGVVLNHW